MKTIKLKAKQTCAVISDLHIGYGKENMQNVLSILSDYDFIVFNGDILELLVNNFEKVTHRGFGLKLLDWMRTNPKKFAYIVGNHDDKLWEMELDLFFPIYSSVRVIQSGNVIACVHGHQFDKTNRKPSVITKFLYQSERFFNWLFRVNWQEIIFKQRRIFTRIGDFFKRRKLPHQRENAISYVRSYGMDYLVHGHTHFPEVYFGTRIIDQGSFVIGQSYVEIKRGKPKLKIIS